MAFVDARIRNLDLCLEGLASVWYHSLTYMHLALKRYLEFLENTNEVELTIFFIESAFKLGQLMVSFHMYP